MQAIQTRYLGPTNTRGSRIKAWCDAGSLTQSWDYAVNGDLNHVAAAAALQHKLGWVGGLYGSLKSGTLPNGDQCHVMVAGA